MTRMRRSEAETYPARFAVEVEATRDLPKPLPDEHISSLGGDEQEDNNLRAKFAAKAVYHYARRTGTLDEEPALSISDMLGDLRHLCDALDLDFDELVERGAFHYSAEIRGEF